MIDLTQAEAEEIFLNKDWLQFQIVAENCPHGPESSYTLVEKREGVQLIQREGTR